MHVFCEEASPGSCLPICGAEEILCSIQTDVDFQFPSIISTNAVVVAFGCVRRGGGGMMALSRGALSPSPARGRGELAILDRITVSHWRIKSFESTHHVMRLCHLIGEPFVAEGYIDYLFSCQIAFDPIHK